MFIRTEKTVNEWPWRSKNGKVHYRKREKSIHHFKCDHCDVEYEHGTYYPAERLNNNGKFSHYCSNCKGQASIKGHLSRRKNLDEMIGDRKIDSMGYPTIYVGKNYPYSDDYGGRIREHVVVVEKHLKRALRRTGVKDGNSEAVHHIDGDKTNNKLSNLQMMTQTEHNKCHAGNDALILELYRMDFVGYDKRKKKYFIRKNNV